MGLHCRLTQHSRLTTWWRPFIKKDGSRGKSVIEEHAWYTPLRSCALCGWLSTPRNVACRNDCYRMEWATPYLCAACWNKVRPIVNAFRELEALKKLTRKLRHARPDVQKTNH